MNKILFFLSLVFLTGNSLLQAQDMNRSDNKGRRQGPWTDFYANGQKRYEGQFKNGFCVGEFKYYDELAMTSLIDRETYLKIAKLSALFRIADGICRSYRTNPTKAVPRD